MTKRWGPHLPRAGWASRRTPETSPLAWPAAPCPTWGCRTGAPGACGSANKGQLQSPSLRARPVRLGPAPPQTRGSLRQDPLLHDVVQGGEDTLPHVALQRRVEVGNDLEGKAGRTVSAAPPRGPSDSTTGRTGRPCSLRAAEPGTCCSTGRRAAEEPRRDADTAGQRGETPGLVEGRGGPFTARRSGGHARHARGAARTRHMKSRSVAVMAGWGFMEWCMTRMAGSVDEHREGRFRAGAQPHSPPFPLGRPQRRRPPKRLVVLVRPRPWHAEERQDEAAFSTADTAPGPSPGSRDKGRGSRAPPPRPPCSARGAPWGTAELLRPRPLHAALRFRPRRGRQRAGRGGRRWPVAATHLCS